MDTTNQSNHEDHMGDDALRALDAAAQSMEIISKKTWERMEQRADAQQKAVLDANIAYADAAIKKNEEKTSTNDDQSDDRSNDQINDSTKKILGDAFYLEIRDIFVHCGLITIHKPVDMSTKTDKTDKTDKTNGKKGKKVKQVIKKVDMIRIENMTKSVKTIAIEICETYNWKTPMSQLSFNSSHIEMVGMGFIYMARYILKKLDHYKKDNNIVQVWSLMVSMQRYINACTIGQNIVGQSENIYRGIDPINPNTKSPMSKIFLHDMMACYNDLNAIFPFDGVAICQRAPELLVHTPLDQYIKITSIQPRDHQKKIIEWTNKYCKSDTPFFVIYNAMIGSGKTTAVVPLLNIAKQYGKILLCVCNLETVRDQMGNGFYNADQSFSIGYFYHGVIKLSQSWAKKTEKPNAIVCSPDVAFKLLTTKSKDVPNPAETYILFHDEPTIGADDIRSNALDENMRVLFNAPKWTIFSSATAPTVQELDTIIKRLKHAHSNEHAKDPNESFVVGRIYSPTVYVVCEVRTADGELVVPFLGCKTSKDLLQTIQKIEDMPFIGRMLASSIAVKLYNELNNIGAPDVPDIPTMFKNVDNLKADKIREIVLSMLKILSQFGSDVISQICSSNLTDVEEVKVPEKNKENKKKNDDLKIDEAFGFEWDESEDDENTNKNNTSSDEVKTKSEFSVDLMNLGSGDIWKGMGLITDTDPLNLAREYFASILKNLDEADIKSADHIVKNYDRDVEEWKTKMEKSLKNQKVSEIKKAIEETKFLDDKPKLQFPVWAQIGTVEYCCHFIPKKDHHKIIDTRLPNTPESIIEHKIEIGKRQNMRFADVTTVPDEILLLLLCGVGIYSPSNKLLDQHYTNLVLKYAMTGNLAYVVADHTIVYGTNHPYGRIIPTDRFVKQHSIQVLLQNMARAGRVGKFAKAEAIVSIDTARMLIDFSIHPERYNVEAENIAMVFAKLETERSNAITAEIKQIEDAEIERMMAEIIKQQEINAEIKQKETKQAHTQTLNEKIHQENVSKPVDDNHQRPVEKKMQMILIEDYDNDTGAILNEQNGWKNNRLNDQPLNNDKSDDRPSNNRPLNDRPSSDRSSSNRPSSDRPSSDRPSSDRPSSDRPSSDHQFNGSWKRNNDVSQSSGNTSWRSNDQRPSNQQPNDQRSSNQQPNNQRPNDQRSSNQRPNDQRPNDQRSNNQRLNDQRPNDQRPNDRRPNDQRPNDQRPNDRRPNDQRSNDQRPNAWRTNDQRPNDQRPNDQRPNDQRPNDQRPNDQRPNDQRPNDQRPNAWRTNDQRSNDQRPNAWSLNVQQSNDPKPNAWRSIDQQPVDQRPIDNRPIDHRPIDHRPIDHRPIDHRPIDQRPNAWRSNDQRGTASRSNEKYPTSGRGRSRR
jgi:hypothetical protein